jgi:uncharacterized protein
MPLLIDGYNLLHAGGIIGAGGPHSLEKSRLALLNFLAESLPEAEWGHATVVFDAAEAPPGLPRVLTHRGLEVRFSAGYHDADELIEELIRAATAPRKLLVVSSDHRLQRAARRRRAEFVDSDVWYARVLRSRAARRAVSPLEAESAKPPVPSSAGEVLYWLRQFGEDDEPGPPQFETTRAAANSPAVGERPSTIDSPIERSAPAGENADEDHRLAEPEALFPPELIEEAERLWRDGR